MDSIDVSTEDVFTARLSRFQLHVIHLYTFLHQGSIEIISSTKDRGLTWLGSVTPWVDSIGCLIQIPVRTELRRACQDAQIESKEDSESLFETP